MFKENIYIPMSVMIYGNKNTIYIMAQRSKTREITITDEGGRFNVIMQKISGSEEVYDFEGLALVRKLLSNEKARLLHTIKSKNPKSLYQLAKMLGRDFKSVSDDIKLLERFGFVEMTAEKTGKRERLRPEVVVDKMNLQIRL